MPKLQPPPFDAAKDAEQPLSAPPFYSDALKEADAPLAPPAFDDAKPADQPLVAPPFDEAKDVAQPKESKADETRLIVPPSDNPADDARRQKILDETAGLDVGTGAINAPEHAVTGDSVLPLGEASPLAHIQELHEQALSQPIIPIPQTPEGFRKRYPIVSGIADTLGGVGNFLQSAEGLGVLASGGAPGAVRALVGGGFAAQGLKDLPEAAAAIGEAAGSGDAYKTTTGVGRALLDAAMAKGGLHESRLTSDLDVARRKLLSAGLPRTFEVLKGGEPTEASAPISAPPPPPPNSGASAPVVDEAGIRDAFLKWKNATPKSGESPEDFQTRRSGLWQDALALEPESVPEGYTPPADREPVSPPLEPPAVVEAPTPPGEPVAASAAPEAPSSRVVEVPLDPSIVDVPEGATGYKVKSGTITATVSEFSDGIYVHDIVNASPGGAPLPATRDILGVLRAIRAKGKPVELTVGRRSGDSNAARLEQFYSRMGFQPVEGAPGRMRLEAAKPAEAVPAVEVAPDKTVTPAETPAPEPVPPAPVERAPLAATVDEVIQDHVAEHGSLAAAGLALDERLNDAATTPQEKALLTRVLRKMNSLAEFEYRRELENQTEGEQGAGKYELITEVKRLGGLPTLSNRGADATGELGRIIESKRGAFLTLFRKGAKNLDDLRQSLNEVGFNFETGYDVLLAIEDSLRSGRRYYGEKDTSGLPHGPGKMTIGELGPQRTTGLKRAVVDDERIQRGLDEIPTAEREPEEARVQRAEDRVDTDPSLAAGIVERIVDKGETAISPDDAAVLLVERTRLMNAREDVEGRLGDWEDVEQNTDRLQDIESQLERLDRAQRAAGSSWGRVGHLYQRMMRADFTLEALESRARFAKGGPLSGEESATIKEQAKQIADLTRKVDESAAKMAEAAEIAERNRVLEATVRDLQADSSGKATFHPKVFEAARRHVERAKLAAMDSRKALREAFGRTNVGADPTLVIHVAKVMYAKVAEFALDKAQAFASMIGEYPELANAREYLEKAWVKVERMLARGEVGKAVKARGKKAEKTTVDIKAKVKAEAVAGEPLQQRTVYELARAAINEGVHGEDAIMAHVHEAVKEEYPDATERDVRRALVNYGKVVFPSADAVAAELRELNTVVRLQESIDRETEGLPALKTGKQRDKASQSIRDKQKQLNELLKKNDRSPSPEKLASRNEARKTALKNQIEDLDRQLQTGLKEPGKAPIPDSPEVEGLIAERDAMRAKLREIEAAENPGPTPAEQQVEGLLKIRTRLDEVLSGARDSLARGEFQPLSDAAEGIKAEIDAMRELAAQLKKDAKPPVDVDAREEAAKIKRLETAIDDYGRKYSDLLAGKPEAASVKLGPDSAKVAELKDVLGQRKAMYELADKAGRPVMTPAERYNSTRAKQIAARIADLQARMKAGNFAPRARTVPPALNAANEANVAALEKVKTEFRKKELAWRRAQRGWFEKATNWVANFARANVLGHISVLEHLGGAAAENIATRPVGTAVAQLFRLNKTMEAIRKKAVREGGLGGEIAGAKATLTSMKAVWEKLRTGKSAMDWLHEGGKVYPHEFMEWVGNLHAAIKEPIRQGIYARMMELGVKAAEEKGLNPSGDPVLYKAISKEAYDQANLDIFTGDNFITKAVHNNVGAYLRGLKGDPGLARFTADVLDVLFPVVNVPVNIAIRKLRLAAGIPEFAGRLAHHAMKGDLANGADKLTPRDAEQITRAFKYGVTGAALAAYAWTHANQFGGIYAPGQQAPRDKKTGLKPGEAAAPEWLTKLTGADHISHHVLHGPWGGHMNMVADARRLYDQRIKKGDNRWGALSESAFFGMFAGVKDLPQFSTIGRLTSPYQSAGQKAAQIVKNIFLFGALQDLAEAMDAKHRKTKTFTDEMKLAVPVLRETLPAKP